MPRKGRTARANQAAGDGPPPVVVAALVGAPQQPEPAAAAAGARRSGKQAWKAFAPEMFLQILADPSTLLRITRFLGLTRKKQRRRRPTPPAAPAAAAGPSSTRSSSATSAAVPQRPRISRSSLFFPALLRALCRGSRRAVQEGSRLVGRVAMAQMKASALIRQPGDSRSYLALERFESIVPSFDSALQLRCCQLGRCSFCHTQSPVGQVWLRILRRSDHARRSFARIEVRSIGPCCVGDEAQRVCTDRTALKEHFATTTMLRDLLHREVLDPRQLGVTDAKPKMLKLYLVCDIRQAVSCKYGSFETRRAEVLASRTSAAAKKQRADGAAAPKAAKPKSGTTRAAPVGPELLCVDPFSYERGFPDLSKPGPQTIQQLNGRVTFFVESQKDRRNRNDRENKRGAYNSSAAGKKRTQHAAAASAAGRPEPKQRKQHAACSRCGYRPRTSRAVGHNIKTCTAAPKTPSAPSRRSAKSGATPPTVGPVKTEKSPIALLSAAAAAAFPTRSARSPPAELNSAAHGGPLKTVML